jgi:hypothetical protein
MKERPILFSAPMVRALLAGTKTQTRRVMARQKQHAFTDYTLFGQRGHPDDEAARRGGWAQPWVAIEHAPDWPDGKDDQCFCPYARERGDRLWVRETYFAFGRWETRFSAKKGRDAWHFVDMTLDAGLAHRYATDGDDLWPMPGRRSLAGATPGWWKRPAIFMPRAASRIDLEITGIRVERLQDISLRDVRAEGCEVREFWLFGADAAGRKRIAADVYRALWQEINGAESWAANPWVWVVEFRRIRP